MHKQEFQTEQPHIRAFEPTTVILDVLRRWYLVVMIMLLVGMTAYIVSDSTYRPAYTTTTTFVVSVRDSSSTVYQNLSATTNLATVFTEVLNSSILRDAILEELGMTSFAGTIRAVPMAETNLLTLQVTASDPRTAFLVTRSVIDNHSIVSAQVMGDTMLEVLQSPHIPTAPSNPQDSYALAKKAALLAAVAMCALLAVLSYMRDTMRTHQEASDKLDCRCLGEIRHEKKYKTLRAFLRHRKNGILITKPSTSFHFVESFRKLRRRVEQQMQGGKQVLLVTSVLENEGKSTVIVNLALSLALKGRRVLLVDCDLRKPSCYKLLERPRRTPATIDVIVGRESLTEAITQDKYTGLYTLLEHRSVPSSTNLIGSDGMAKLIEEARTQFDLILIDLPPTSVSPDAEALIDLADGALLVVQQNKSTAIQVNNTISALDNTHTKLLGCVLNNVYASSLSGSSYGYGYGGYGTYGKYGSYGKYQQYGHPGNPDSAENTNQ